jgi:hypothetical protein
MLHFNRKFRFILVAVLCCAAGVAMASQTGTKYPWSGVLPNGNDKPIGVEASFGDQLIHLHLEGQTGGCQFDAKFLQTTGDSSDYTVRVSTNGGALCQKFYPGTLTTKITGDSMTLTLQPRGGATSQAKLTCHSSIGPCKPSP